MSKITKKQAIALLDQAVETRGENYTVDECSYFTKYGEPNCIVGHVLDALGKTRDDLSVKSAPVPPNRASFDTITVRGLKFTDKAFAVLDVAQKVQDGRNEYVYGDRSWGNAVRVAKEA